MTSIYFNETNNLLIHRSIVNATQSQTLSARAVVLIAPKLIRKKQKENSKSIVYI